jgi:hypothetical protein
MAASCALAGSLQSGLRGSLATSRSLGSSSSSFTAAAPLPTFKQQNVRQRSRGVALSVTSMAKELHFNKDGSALKRMQVG